MKVRIRAFGPLTDVIQGPLELENVEDTHQVEAYLRAHFPGFGKTRYLMAVDRQTVTGNTPLKEGSEIALLPAFSGG